MSRSLQCAYRRLQFVCGQFGHSRVGPRGIHGRRGLAPSALSDRGWDPKGICKEPQASPRLFHSTPSRPKGKSSPKRSVQIASQRSEAAGDDPFDFNDLNKSIAEAHDRLRTKLRQISPAGQVTQESVEAVRVKLKSGDVVSVSDLGQVVHKGGRNIAIMVGQDKDVKYVSSAILSQLAINPVPTAQDPQQLHVAIPAPTQESRKNAQKQVIEAGERAQTALRNARAAQQKRHRAMEVSRRVQGDDLRKAGKEMDKVMEKSTAEAKKTIEAAKKAMER